MPGPLTISIPPFSHYVVLRDMKASGRLYYRGQVIEPPQEWGHQLQTLIDVKYVAPVPQEISTTVLQVNGCTFHFVNQAFADLAAKVLVPEETEEPPPKTPRGRKTNDS